MAVTGGPVRIILFLLALSLPIVTLVWVMYPDDMFKFHGFSLNPLEGDGESQWQYFNLHPLLMVGGYGFLGTSAVSAFKLLPVSHDAQKYIHVALHIVAIALTTGSLLVVMTYKEVSKQDEFYSPHAWLGIASLAAYDLNALVAFVLFIVGKLACSRASETARRVFVPAHRFFGFIIYASTMGAILTGIAGRMWIAKIALHEVKNVEGTLMMTADYLTMLVTATLCCVVFVLYHTKNNNKQDEYDMIPTDDMEYGSDVYK
eukprot:TRINITY_DN2022_c0_g2_i1.p1 TRINITY_DN2022_c0_g2~~TRINITY_DN2022_c0_g2_i1.p1  ORF type:complete len:268 (+),score=61.79 TRINITY_DN2022_c0_g2_i1:26-805(+)